MSAHFTRSVVPRHAVPVLLTSLVISACSSPGPSTGDVEAFLTSRMPEHVEVDVDEVKAFPMEGGAGRVSVSGVSRLAEDTYRPSPRVLEEHFGERGWEPAWYSWAYQKAEVGVKSPVVLAASAGHSEPFSADLLYEETVDGWRFWGTVPSVDDLGLPESQLGPDHLVVGSPQYNEVTARIEAASNERNAIYTEIDQWAAGWFRGDLIMRRSDATGSTDMFRVRLGPPSPRWFEVRAFNRPNLTLDGTAEWLSEGRWANDTFAAGESTPMRIVVRAVIEQDGRWGTTVRVMVQDDRGRFYHTGTYLTYREMPERYELLGRSVTWTLTPSNR